MLVEDIFSLVLNRESFLWTNSNVFVRMVLLSTTVILPITLGVIGEVDINHIVVFIVVILTTFVSIGLKLAAMIFVTIEVLYIYFFGDSFYLRNYWYFFVFFQAVLSFLIFSFKGTFKNNKNL